MVVHLRKALASVVVAAMAIAGSPSGAAVAGVAGRLAQLTQPPPCSGTQYAVC